VEDVDCEHLINLSRQGNNISIRCDVQKGRLDYLKICDNNKFHELRITRGRSRYSPLNIHLTLSPTNYLGDNSENLNWTEYSAAIQETLTYIAEEYRIVLDSSAAKLRYAELNCTIPINGRCIDYDRVIKLLLSFLPDHMVREDWSFKKEPKNKKPNDALTRNASNKEMSISIYNKSAQLKSKGKIAENDDAQTLLRIELRLKTIKKITKELGSNVWCELSDGNIAYNYHRIINDEIISKYVSWQADRKQEIKDRLITYRKSRGTWQYRIMQYVRNESERLDIPYILDIEQVADALTALGDKHRNTHRSIQLLMTTRTEQDVYFNNALAKAQEIIDGINTAYETSLCVAR
jgi:hypothetical protein